MRRPRQLQKNQGTKRDNHSPNQWRSLMQKVIARAKHLKDPRVSKFEDALRQGTTEAMLRKLSIICEADIHREFPV